MGFGRFIGDLLLGKTNCPLCGTPGSTKEGDRIRCLNPQCANFILSPGQSIPPQGQPAQGQPPQSPRPAQSAPASAPSGPGMGSARSITIQYKNFQNQPRTFTADAGTLRRANNHIIARVAPKGTFITLSRDRIQNLPEVDQALPPNMRSDRVMPTPRERQVLGYHRKHKSTSPLYEKIRAKYPDW